MHVTPTVVLPIYFVIKTKLVKVKKISDKKRRYKKRCHPKKNEESIR